MSFILGYWLIWAAIMLYVAIRHTAAVEKGPVLLLGMALMLVVGPIMVPLMLVQSWRDVVSAKE